MSAIDLQAEVDRLTIENREMTLELINLRGGRCTGCGCTDEVACIGGCSWVKLDPETGKGICSNCAPLGVAANTLEIEQHA